MRYTLLILLIITLSGCQDPRLNHIGHAPPLSRIQNPQLNPQFQAVNMPTPQPEVSQHRYINSLWQPGAKAFFRDQRAKRVGDILTVQVNIADTAEFKNDTSRSRQASEEFAASNFLGLETNLTHFLPKGVDPAKLVGITSNPNTTGTGTTKRSETVTMQIPATITQVLPNGNLVVAGRQELRVNNEVRDFEVHGVIRSSDISSSNMVDYSKMAEARISYGGRGIISDFQKPAWGQEVFNAITPF